MLYTLEYLTETFNRLKWQETKYEKYAELIKSLERIISKDSIKQIYPKNLFLDDEEIELYAFAENYICVTKFNNDKKITNSIIKNKDIKSLELIEGNEYQPVVLNIYFYDESKITLDTTTDCNEAHMTSFNENIRVIVSSLLGAC